MTTSRVSVASLIALTPEAEAALDNRKEVHIRSLPFKVGRESRTRVFDRVRTEMDRRLAGRPAVNNLYLLEPPAPLLHISREHFLIDWVDGRFALFDRASACGTIVSGKAIGGDSSTTCVELRDGDTIVVGRHESPFVLQFRVI